MSTSFFIEEDNEAIISPPIYPTAEQNEEVEPLVEVSIYLVASKSP